MKMEILIEFLDMFTCILSISIFISVVKNISKNTIYITVHHIIFKLEIKTTLH